MTNATATELAQPRTIERAIQATLKARYPAGFSAELHYSAQVWHDGKIKRINTLRARLVDSIAIERRGGFKK